MKRECLISQYCTSTSALFYVNKDFSDGLQSCTFTNIRRRGSEPLSAPCSNVPRGRPGTCPTFPDPCGASPSPDTEARKNRGVSSRAGRQSDSVDRKVNPGNSGGGSTAGTYVNVSRQLVVWFSLLLEHLLLEFILLAAWWALLYCAYETFHSPLIAAKFSVESKLTQIARHTINNCVSSVPILYYTIMCLTRPACRVFCCWWIYNHTIIGIFT